MNFVHPKVSSNDTIAAIASALGEGGVAVLRISGPKASQISQKALSVNLLSFPPSTVKFAKVVDEKETVVDEVLCFWMKGPRTFTGEDVVEIHCHGGVIIPKKILALLVRLGARLALPGEFSQRAFLNGKIDLTQAEAIGELIHARSEFAYASAKNQLMGTLSAQIVKYQQKLTDLTAIIEASVDYPEEDLEFATKAELEMNLLEILTEMEKLLISFYHGQKLCSGLKLCILGLPNVGKSSLLNALLRKDRAIVTPIAGTTRDVIEEEFLLGELSLRLIDTAGIRETDELIEQEGIKRSFAKANEADIILFVTEGYRDLLEKEQSLLESLPLNKVLILRNKMDEAPLKLDFPHPYISISAKMHQGLDLLEQKIKEKAFSSSNIQSAEIYITQQRHYEALKEASLHLERAIEGLKNDLSPEFITIDLRESLFHLGLIIGRNISEDILDSIFSKFCVGK